MNTDPIADLLTRIRNAGGAQHARTTVPNSRVKREILRVLEEEGYIAGFEQTDGVGPGNIRIRLKFHDGKHVITGLRRQSKPGQRRYVGCEEIPEILNGLGVAIMTTSKGVMTGKQAKEQGVGGELLCTVW